MSLKALILTGDGINCERETAEAFRQVGFQPVISHLNDLIASRLSLDEMSKTYAALALPGGFSFGDDLGSGRVLALKMKHGLDWDLQVYANRGGLVIGICNGFQALIRLGVFGKEISITNNVSGAFMNRWVRLRTQSAQSHPSVWTRKVLALGRSIELPIRHGEGRIVRTGTAPLPQCLEYEINPNGSLDAAAGLTDSTGRILGLMPHPEAYLRLNSHPDWMARRDEHSHANEGYGDGLLFFQSGFEAAKGST